MDANDQSTHALRVAGSGGLFGRGTGSFASAEPYPLPEAHGDFALSVWAHEHGVVGTLLVLGLALAIVLGALAVAGRAAEASRGAGPNRGGVGDGRDQVRPAPLNLVGVITPGPRLAAHLGTHVAYRDGVPIQPDGAVGDAPMRAAG